MSMNIVSEFYMKKYNDGEPTIWEADVIIEHLELEVRRLIDERDSSHRVSDIYRKELYEAQQLRLKAEESLQRINMDYAVEKAKMVKERRTIWRCVYLSYICSLNVI